MADKFFVKPANPRKRTLRQARAENKKDIEKDNVDNDENITSDSDVGEEIEVSSSESDDENEADKRRRLAKEYLNSLESEVVEGFDAKDLDEDIIARRLRHDAAEEKGHIFRDLRNAEVSPLRKTRLTQSKHLTCVASLNQLAFVGAKDGSVTKLRLKPSGDENAVKGHIVSRVLCETKEINRPLSSSVLCIAVSSKYVACGFKNGFVILNAESLETLKEFKIHGSVLSLAFRRGTHELYVGASDLRLRTYDLNQFAFVETLHGHQDEIVGLSALSMERCVSVGSRDRTAIFWKIPEESRLTFRGGDTKVAANLDKLDQKERISTVLEGSIDCCSMLDHQLFVTGSDNGNVCLWSTGRKKPVQITPKAHGLCPELTPQQASGELDPEKVEIPPAQPHAITAIAAIPFSNTFITGSDSGFISVWCIDEEKRNFSLKENIDVGSGVVTGISVAELEDDRFCLCLTLSREPRLGRWVVHSGRDQLVTIVLK